MTAGITGALAGGLCVLSRRLLEGRPASRGQNRVVQFRPLYNAGAGFGWKSLRGPALIKAAAAALVPVVFWTARSRSPLARIGGGMALAGGLSNLWERVRRGRVFDYLRFPWAPGRLGRLSFNLADLWILLGLCLLLAAGRRKA